MGAIAGAQFLDPGRVAMRGRVRRRSTRWPQPSRRLPRRVTSAPGVSAADAPSYTIIHPAATLLPTATPTLTPEPTLAPTALPTATPMPPPTPTAAMSPVPAVPEQPVIPEQDSGPSVRATCVNVPDEFFVVTRSELPAQAARELGCPNGPATDSPGVWQTFERGAVIAPADRGAVYVYYAANGEWEMVTLPSAGPSELGESPNSPIAVVLRSEARRVALGSPQAAEQSVTVVSQPFEGGLLLGNRDDGSVAVLTRSKQLFR